MGEEMIGSLSAFVMGTGNGIGCPTMAPRDRKVPATAAPGGSEWVRG